MVRRFDEKVALGPVKRIPVESATQPESQDHSEKSVIVSLAAETQGAIGNKKATAKGATGTKKAAATSKVPMLELVFLFLNFVMLSNKYGYPLACSRSWLKFLLVLPLLPYRVTDCQ